jgi:hypothetical protein
MTRLLKGLYKYREWTVLMCMCVHLFKAFKCLIWTLCVFYVFYSFMLKLQLYCTYIFRVLMTYFKSYGHFWLTLFSCNVMYVLYAYYVEFDILTMITMKNIILWIVTSYSQMEFHRRFGGMYCFHLQSRKTTGLHGATSLKIKLFDHHSNLCISINVVRKNKSWSMRWVGHIYCYMYIYC